MSYLRAEELLPEELVKEIQKYIQGVQLYIPKVEKARLGWGQKNGTRERLSERNSRIRSLKEDGWKIDDIAELYNLSSDSIRKIVYRG